MSLSTLSSSCGQINQSGLLTLITRLPDQSVVLGSTRKVLCERTKINYFCEEKRNWLPGSYISQLYRLGSTREVFVKEKMTVCCVIICHLLFVYEVNQGEFCESEESDFLFFDYPARALRALGLLLADGDLTVGRGKTFWRANRFFFFYENSRNSGTESRKMVPKVGNERSLWGLQTGQNWGRMAKIGFLDQKPKFWAQKKITS